MFKQKQFQNINLKVRSWKTNVKQAVSGNSSAFYKNTSLVFFFQAFCLPISETIQKQHVPSTCFWLQKSSKKFQRLENALQKRWSPGEPGARKRSGGSKKPTLIPYSPSSRSTFAISKRVSPGTGRASALKDRLTTPAVT